MGNLNDKNELNNLIGRCIELLEDMVDNDDIRIQIQYSTIIIKKIDKMKEFYNSNEKRKIEVLDCLRGFMKDSCEDLFTKNQIILFSSMLKSLMK